MMDEAELARRAILNFGEMLASLGRCAVGPEAEVRRPDALGARIEVATNPWFDAAVVPLDATPSADDSLLPNCRWSVAEAVRGEEVASLSVLGEINERAYEDIGMFGPLIRELRDDRVRVHGLRENGAFVCVAMTFALGTTSPSISLRPR